MRSREDSKKQQSYFWRPLVHRCASWVEGASHWLHWRATEQTSRWQWIVHAASSISCGSRISPANSGAHWGTPPGRLPPHSETSEMTTNNVIHKLMHAAKYLNWDFYQLVLSETRIIGTLSRKSSDCRYNNVYVQLHTVTKTSSPDILPLPPWRLTDLPLTFCCQRQLLALMAESCWMCPLSHPASVPNSSGSNIALIQDLCRLYQALARWSERTG